MSDDSVDMRVVERANAEMNAHRNAASDTFRVLSYAECSWDTAEWLREEAADHGWNVCVDSGDPFQRGYQVYLTSPGVSMSIKRTVTTKAAPRSWWARQWWLPRWHEVASYAAIYALWYAIGVIAWMDEFYERESYGTVAQVLTLAVGAILVVGRRAKYKRMDGDNEETQ